MALNSRKLETGVAPRGYLKKGINALLPHTLELAEEQLQIASGQQSLLFLEWRLLVMISQARAFHNAEP
jgi:hypothetical protein